MRCIGSHFLLPIISITHPRWPAVANIRSSAFQPQTSSTPRHIRSGTNFSALGTFHGRGGNKFRSPLPGRSVHAASNGDTAECDSHMDGELAALIKHIHSLPTKTVIYATGGGVQVTNYSYSYNITALVQALQHAPVFPPIRMFAAFLILPRTDKGFANADAGPVLATDSARLKSHHSRCPYTLCNSSPRSGTAHVVGEPPLRPDLCAACWQRQ